MSSRSFDPLFTLPQPPPIDLAPCPIPGHTSSSQQALVRLLKKNHELFHCFFNARGFHNHLAHHLFASYALGAKASLLDEIFEKEAPTLLPKIKPPNPIDDSNWKRHLGDERYYDAYLSFYSGKLLEYGVGATLERFVFSKDANLGSEGSQSPHMLNRLVGGLLHPLIHLGHGAETRILGLAAEGLAQAAVHSPVSTALLPADFFSFDESSVTKTLASLNLRSSPDTDTDVFTIIQRILDDPKLAAGQCAEESSITKYRDTLQNRGDVIRSYCKAWTVMEGNMPKKFEELAWATTLIYGIGGWSKDKGFKADFFTMHLVTSCIFVPSILAYLSPSSQSALLRAYFSVCITYWVSRGRPSFPIEQFFASTDETPSPPLSQPKPNDALLDKTHLIQNPWYQILASCMAHPAEHLLKLQRSLVHFGALYGAQPKGHFQGNHLKGAEHLDGTLFIRVAGLSAARLGWVREGENEGGWDG